MTEEQELELIKENKKWTLKVYGVIWTAVVAIIGVLGLIFGKIVEATLFEEVAKWALMAIVIGLIVCVICYVPVTMLSDARLKLRSEYGKGWFKQALKVLFGRK